jgi:hypothetical protein
MRRSSRSTSVVGRSIVACVAFCAMATSCGDDDDSSATTLAGGAAAADTTEAATTAETATVASTAGAASGDACADREQLRSSVTALSEVQVVADGTDELRAAVDAVESDLEQVRASAGSTVEPQVQAIRDAIAATEAGLANLGEGGAAEVATALTALSTATTDLMTTLEDGPCS